MIALLRQHAQALRSAFAKLFAQPLVSAVSIVVMAIALALPLLFAVVVKSAFSATARLDTEPHVNVFLTLDAGPEDVKRIEAAIRASDAVAGVRFIPREEALKELRANSHLADVIDSLEKNPLPHAFTIRPKATSSAEATEALRAALAKLPKVESASGDQEWARKLARAAGVADRIAVAFALILGTAVLFITANTIRLQVLTQREEIEVAQLIGATGSYVRRPFLYFGLVQAILAAFLALLLCAGAVAWINGEVRALTSSYSSDLQLIFPSPSYLLGFLGLVASLGLGAAAAAVRLQLRRFAAPSR
jgi:cell division transport system permease protein